MFMVNLTEIFCEKFVFITTLISTIRLPYVRILK